VNPVPPLTAHPPVFADWLAESAADRDRAGLRRDLRARDGSGQGIDLASNDYLGLATREEVLAGAAASLYRYGAGATGSRLVTGTTEEHARLEDELADFLGTESALVFSSGYTANLGAVTALSGPGALVLSDTAVHASLVDACRMSRARVQVVDHRDLEEIERLLAARSEPRAVVLVDAVHSADGTLADVARLHVVCRDHGAVLIVDDAHGLGVRGTGGRGWAHESGLSGAPDVVITTTLSKSLGSQGGAVLASAAVRTHLIDTARTFIFDTGLAPAAVGAARAALAVLRAEPDLPARALDRATALARIAARATGGTAAGAAAGADSAVVPVILGDPQTAVAAAAQCRIRGVAAGCFRPPSVPASTARLRLTARATLTDAELDAVAAVLDTAVRIARAEQR